MFGSAIPHGELSVDPVAPVLVSARSDESGKTAKGDIMTRVGEPTRLWFFTVICGLALASCAGPSPTSPASPTSPGLSQGLSGSGDGTPAIRVLQASTEAIHGDDLSPEVRQQLAAAREATAKYHDVNEALADGYVYFGVNPAEGNIVEFVNFALVDCALDVLHPESLRYVQSGERLRLVAVEYAIPMGCSATPPEGFLPGAGEWEAEAGVPAWMLGVPLWSGKSDDAH